MRYEKSYWYLEVQMLGAAKQSRLAAGDKSDNRIPIGGTPGWIIGNIQAGFTWKFAEMSLAFNNISNADYRYHGSSVNGMGRSLTFGLSLHY